MTCQILAACHLFECAGTSTATLKLRLESCIISPSSLGSLCAKLHWKMDFLASDAVRPQPRKTLCTATPAMRVILKGWGVIYERWGGSLVLSPLPVMVQWGLHLTIMLMLWIPLLPFLIFASSTPPSASFAYVLSALCPYWHGRVIMRSSSNLADYISDETIISISNTSSSSVPLLQHTLMVVNIFYIISWTSENLFQWAEACSLIFLSSNVKRITEKKCSHCKGGLWLPGKRHYWVSQSQ